MKKSLERSLALLCVLAALTATAHGAPALSARHAILMEPESGRVLYELSADEQSLIASTTKIMTALVVCEQCNPEARVRIMPEAVGVEGSSMYLRAGEMLSVRELLYGLMLRSGNDAATALAIFAAGSVEAFAARMNAKAALLGLNGTHFANPHGLDAPEHYSTARDLAALTAYALRSPLFREIVSTKSITLGERVIQNHNKLLWRYDGAIGVKTGFTKAAGRILVSAAARDGRELVAVTIHAPDDWNDHAALLDYGFSLMTETCVVTGGETVCEVPLMTGGLLRLFAPEDVTAFLLPDETVQRVILAPKLAWDGEDALDAALVLLRNGRELQRIALCAEEETACRSEFKNCFRNTASAPAERRSG